MLQHPDPARDDLDDETWRPNVEGPPTTPPGVSAEPEPLDQDQPEKEAHPAPSDEWDLLPAPTIAQGQVVFNKYRLEKKLGQGGMGEVWLVENMPLQKKSALKLIDPKFAQAEKGWRRFEHEARVMAKITHHNAVTVYDFRRTQSMAYIEMEFVQGRSLEQYLKEQKGPVTLEWTAKFLDQLCSVLQMAHGFVDKESGKVRPIIHRDLKPSNLMLDDDKPEGQNLKVLDFGIAKMVQEEGSPELTGQDEILGTPHYMSPEQIRGGISEDGRGGIDGRSDIYSVGVLLYQLLTGSLPFKGRTKMEVLMARLHQAPTPMKEMNPKIQIPSQVERLVMSCLEKEPSKRPQNARVLIEQFKMAIDRPWYQKIFNKFEPQESPAGQPSPQPEAKADSSNEEQYAALLFDEADPAISQAPSPTGPAPRLFRVLRNGQTPSWSLTQPYYSVGQKGAKIPLEDRQVSRWHLGITQIGGIWLAFNVSRTNSMKIGDQPLGQKRLQNGDAINIGHSWLVFVADNGSANPRLRPWQAGTWPHSAMGVSKPGVAGTRRQPDVRTIDSLDDEEIEETAAECKLFSGEGNLAVSTGEPLLIGSNPACRACLKGPRVAPFHAALCWTTEGVEIFGLESGNGLKVDGKPVDRKGRTPPRQILNDGQEVTLGESMIRVQIAGDPMALVRERVRRARSVTPGLELTVLHGPCRDESVALPNEHKIILGSHLDVDLALAGDPWISARHLELTVQSEGRLSPILQVKDRGSHQGTMINREPVKDTAEARAGDVIQFGGPGRAGPTAILIHYPLCLDRWEDRSKIRSEKET